MDNAGDHATDLSYPGIQIGFLAPNTTSLIQPMDQGVIRVFKVLYTKNTLTNLVYSMDAAQEDGDFNLKDYWWRYTIATCFQNIQKALQGMKPYAMSSSLKKLCPEVVCDDEGLTPGEIQYSAVHEAVQLAAMLRGEGFADMTTNDVSELLDYHSQLLTNEDLEEFTKSASKEEDEEQEDMEEDVFPTGLTLERLAKICKLAKQLQKRSQE